jgi:uridine kinase
MGHLISIAGCSGSGKSTLAYSLQERFPMLVEVVYFTDYQKPIEQIPFYQEMRNWDCPEAIDFDRLLSDLNLLKNGKDVEIMTKNERHNPTYPKDWKRIPYVIRAKDIIIVEGYMALVDDRVRRLYDLSIFLDLCSEERMKRRRTKKQSQEYIERILIPMQEIHVEPTKRLADIVIDIKEHGTGDVQEQILAVFKAKGFL